MVINRKMTGMFAISIAALLGSCGGKVKSEFVAGCTAQGAPKSKCTCLYGKLKDRYGEEGLEAMQEGKTELPGMLEATVVGTAQCSGVDPAVALRRLGIEPRATVAGETHATIPEAAVSRAPTTPEPAGSSSGAAQARGSSAECIEDQDGAPSFGSLQDDGRVFLCREPVEIYWNDWYGSKVDGNSNSVKIVGEGKTSMFEGELRVDCNTNSAYWASASTGFGENPSEEDIREAIPERVISNARRYVCG